ncbi:PAS domain-containing sensor histidine kinase [Tunturiibacter gelidoferens]|uniref:histidine kinase n=2 Tax=Tunturiibacter gelidiferens TaxID=3069689 RepID=A0AAU7YXG4_9BACT|nr:PAS domain S-box protein [Edaphobacter lichenicola]MBB5338326.1 PAS domain S-box-containing protein [Edaphobacter lichenicola]
MTVSAPAPTARAKTLITGNSEMADRIRAHEWSSTPLGPIEDWSETLVTTVNLMLHSPFPTILSWGPEMVFLYNDAAIPTLMGKHPSALGGLYRDVFPEAWDLVSADLNACLYQGLTAVRDNMFIPIFLDGVLEDHYWSYSLIPVYENARIVGIYDAYRNTTDIVMGARKLRESETKLKLATEVAKLGVFMWDTLEDSGIWENDQMYEIFGRTREEGPINGSAFINEVVHPDFRQSFREATESTLQNGTPFQFEGMICRPDKTLRWIEVCGQLQPKMHGSAGQILGTVRDITEVRSGQEAVRNSSKRLSELAAIVESSDDVIVSKDLNGIITSWNAAATRVFGYSADEIVGSSILRLIPEHLHSDEKTIIASIRSGKRVEHFETVRLTKGGRLVEVSLTVSPIRDEHGRVIGASKILRDISGRKRIEESLLQAEKIAATGRMAATIAHEINNPLESVMNLLYLLRPMITDPSGINYLSSAEDELGRVAHIAKQTLGYYREHASASNASLKEIALHAITIYEPRCKASSIEIRTALDSSAKIVLRRGEMMQVISNLIANSIYAMPAGGVLSVSVEDAKRSTDGMILTVQDDGVGIAPEHLPRVFDAFFTTRSTVGTGIGLFVAKQFVEGHGGQIEIESSDAPENHGTTIRIFLPKVTAYHD